MNRERINRFCSFFFSYKTGDGITAEEQGILKNPGVKDAEAQAVQGSYSFVGPDGLYLNSGDLGFCLEFYDLTSIKRILYQHLFIWGKCKNETRMQFKVMTTKSRL